ncbi:cycloheximide resistance protein, Mfs transporter [Rhodotorula toruloides]|uniref:Cycloheximide resistance protein, Mfs transporter n=1 Tax=Rhodotorula toruloides TaxID=5286 RepID=A0A511KNX5_RHOTO|nr:cycloheximide resistance protein, Mfs transporter [Rhodotorula toruloides]
MAWGILEDKHYPNGDVPGTALLDDKKATNYDQNVVEALKKGTGRSSHVVLVPQPSDDPNDPLNWPAWLREANFWVLTFVAGIVGGVGPALAPGYAFLAEQWNITVNAVAATNGDLVIALGCIMILIPPVAAKIGRRPVYLLGGLCLFLCSIWSAVSKNLTSFKWSRVFQGFGMAAFEALVVSTIADTYFVHQRGVRSAIWGFAILAGINLTPIINGYVISDPSLGYRWAFWLLAIVLGVGFLGIFFFCAETAYERDAVFAIDEHGIADAAAVNSATDELEKSSNGEAKPIGQIEHLENGSSVSSRNQISYKPRKTYLQMLSPVSYWGPVNVFKLILRPFPFFLSPVVWLVFFVYGMTTVWLVVLSICSSVLFGAPPYHFDATQTGLTSIGPLVGSIPATIIAGPLCDWLATWMARQNGGTFEPEFRLVLIFPSFLLEFFGFIGWAVITQKNEAGANIPWIGPVMMYTLINVGQSVLSTAIIAYLIDCHRGHTAEAVAVVNLSKNLILYGFTQFAINMILKLGIPQTMYMLSGLLALSLAPTIPMWFYGKRVRSWIARHEKLFLVDK